MGVKRKKAKAAPASDPAREFRDRLRKFVVDLNVVAKKHEQEELGFTPFPSKKRVLEHCEALRAVAPEDVAQCEALQAVAPEEERTERKFELNSSAFLLTFNSKILTPASFDFFVRDYVKAKIDELKVRNWTACVEESLNCEEIPGQRRFHFHVFLELRSKLHLHGIESLRYQPRGSQVAITPNVKQNWAVDDNRFLSKAASGSTKERSVDMGHFYCWMRKNGHISEATNFEPWVHYAPDLRKLQKWSESGKLPKEAYLEYRSKSVTGHAAAPPSPCEEC